MLMSPDFLIDSLTVGLFSHVSKLFFERWTLAQPLLYHVIGLRDLFGRPEVWQRFSIAGGFTTCFYVNFPGS